MDEGMRVTFVTAVLACTAAAGCLGGADDSPVQPEVAEATPVTSEALTNALATYEQVLRPGGASSGGLSSAVTPALSGAVLAKPRVVSVLWGPGVYAQTVADAPTFYSDLVTGPYFGLLSSYGVSQGSFAGQKQITPSNGTTALSASIVQTELQKDVQNNVLPAWDANTVYVVHTPPGFTVTDASGTQQCAFHDKFTFSSGGTQHTSAYAIVTGFGPTDFCAGPNFVVTPYQSEVLNEFVIASHEVIEAAVNPFGGNPEVGDPCQDSKNNGGQLYTSFLGTTNAWFVQKPWIASTRSCAVLPTPAPITPSAASSDAFAVSRQAGNLDVFEVRSDGVIYNDFWNSNGWGVTATTNPNSAAPGAPIAATARTPTNLDTFWLGTDGALYTAFWSAGNNWGALRVTNPNSGPSASNLAAVARTANNLDVFWMGFDGNLWTAFWSPSNGWGVSRVTSDGNGVAGGGIAAVARTKNNIDVFWINRNGALQTAFWSAGNPWGTVLATGNSAATAGSSIAAVTRVFGRLEVFWVDPSGRVQQSIWFDREGSAPNWQTFAVPPSVGYSSAAHISAVTRQADNIDLFLVGTDGAIYNPNFSQQTGWGQVKTTNGGLAPNGAAIAGTTRTPTNLDAFEVGTDASYHTQFWHAGANWGTIAIP